MPLILLNKSLFLIFSLVPQISEKDISKKSYKGTQFLDLVVKPKSLSFSKYIHGSEVIYDQFNSPTFSLICIVKTGKYTI